MKKIIAVLMAALLMLSLASGCAKTNLPSPITDYTADEFAEKTGYCIELPTSSTDAEYSVITDGNDIAQVKFTLDGTQCCYRITSADKISDISGMYYDWTVNKTDCEISYCPAEVHYIDGEQGYCVCYDVVSGQLYCVSVDSGASEETLIALAESLFVPAQGDSE